MQSKQELSAFTREQLIEKIQLCSSENNGLKSEVSELTPKVFTSHPALTPAQNAEVNLLMNKEYIFSEDHRDVFINTYVKGRQSRDTEIEELKKQIVKLKSGGHV